VEEICAVVGVVTNHNFRCPGRINNHIRRDSLTHPRRKVNILQMTYELTKDNSQFKFEYRGKISAKVKGEIDIYFVD
jgi:hypothetical protein